MLDLRRREVITLIGGLAATWPVAVRGQQLERTQLVGVLMSDQDEVGVNAFRQELDALATRDGRPIRVEVRYSSSDISLARKAAAELFAMTPDIFLANNTQMTQLISEKTHSIPIVFVQVPDPIGSGFVASFARPGGNLTGFTNFDPSMGGKWLELLKDVSPRLASIAVILQKGNPTAPPFLKAIEDAAPSFSVRVTPFSLSDGPEIDAAINSFAPEPNGGLIVLPSAFASFHRDKLVAIAARSRLPAIYPLNEFAAAGGLMSYGFDRKNFFQQAASYVHRILKGDKPGDLPVQTPTKFQFVINLKTAHALGIKISANVLSLADEVIE